MWKCMFLIHGQCLSHILILSSYLSLLDCLLKKGAAHKTLILYVIKFDKYFKTPKCVRLMTKFHEIPVQPVCRKSLSSEVRMKRAKRSVINCKIFSIRHHTKLVTGCIYVYIWYFEQRYESYFIHFNIFVLFFVSV